MMGVICAFNRGVKRAGHQQDKYKLKPMRVSFLLDRLVFAGCRRLPKVHLPFGLPLQFQARRQKAEIRGSCPYLPPYRRHDSGTTAMTSKAASKTIFMKKNCHEKFLLSCYAQQTIRSCRFKAKKLPKIL